MPVGFRFDLNSCTGCQACELACTIENELPWGQSWRQVLTFNEARDPSLPLYHLSLACNHCASAPCMTQCPALAITREPSGAVTIHGDRCIGCRYCTWACPYDAPKFDSVAGIATKCTFCDHRLAEGLEPACVTGCPTGALTHGDVRTMDGTDLVAGFPERDHEPAIRFVPLRATRPELPSSGPVARPGRAASKVVLANEWPLLAFSLAAASLVAWLTAHVTAGVRLVPAWFVLAAVAAAGVSTLHLGRKLRAWRAILNVRRSWLSREIASYTLFGAVATAAVTVAPALGWAAVGCGFIALFCIDRVYDVAERPWPSCVHSADAILSGWLLAGVFAREPWLAALAAAVVLGLYAARKLRRRSGPALAVARLGIGIVLPAACWWADLHAWAVGSVFAGVAIDRVEFYLELEVSSPQRQIVAALS